MGLYDSATANNDTTLFHALLSYLNVIITGTKSSEIEVPVYQFSTHCPDKIKDVIIARNDKPLAGVRITVSPSKLIIDNVQVSLSENEIAEASKPDPSDDAAERLRKAVLPKTKIAVKKSYSESIWTIHIRTKSDHGMTFAEYTGTPFDNDKIEEAFMAIIEIVK